MEGLMHYAITACLLFVTTIGNSLVWANQSDIKPGLYISHDMKLDNIRLEPFGNGLKLKTCGSLTNGFCFPMEALIYPEGPLWGGSGKANVYYSKKKCSYDVRFKIKVLGNKLKVDYYGPSHFPGRSYNCPSLSTVKSEWSAIERLFVFAEPCLPSPIFKKGECVGGIQ